VRASELHKHHGCIKPAFYTERHKFRRFADCQSAIQPITNRRYEAFMQEPEVARREHIPVPKGPVEVW